MQSALPRRRAVGRLRRGEADYNEGGLARPTSTQSLHRQQSSLSSSNQKSTLSSLRWCPSVTFHDRIHFTDNRSVRRSPPPLPRLPEPALTEHSHITLRLLEENKEEVEGGTCLCSLCIFSVLDIVKGKDGEPACDTESASCRFHVRAAKGWRRGGRGLWPCSWGGAVPEDAPGIGPLIHAARFV